ncbi:MAG: radical SAM protein, partial [Candidatus Latescibacteria bacterium]|nr:radical SAM protein [Candidatus Latescibacterota bacterium]
KLMISLDSAIENTYKKIRIGAKLSDAVNAIKIAQKFVILDSINFTLQELNASAKEIKAIGKLAHKLQIKSINFLGLKPNAACATNTRLVANFDKLFREITNIGDKYKINVKVDEPFYKPWLVNSKFQIPNSKFSKQGPIVADEKSGCIFGEYLFIEPDGTTKPCSFSPLSFQEIGFDVIKKIQNKRNRKGKCGQCRYQSECGGCRVRTYTLTGDWLASDPYCPL